MAEGWQVIGQLQQQRLSETGRLEDVWEVTYRTEHGAVGTVRVPARQYEPEHVRQMIEAEVAKIAAVHEL